MFVSAQSGFYSLCHISCYRLCNPITNSSKNTVCIHNMQEFSLDDYCTYIIHYYEKLWESLTAIWLCVVCTVHQCIKQRSSFTWTCMHACLSKFTIGWTLVGLTLKQRKLVSRCYKCPNRDYDVHPMILLQKMFRD